MDSISPVPSPEAVQGATSANSFRGLWIGGAVIVVLLIAGSAYAYAYQLSLFGHTAAVSHPAQPELGIQTEVEVPADQVGSWKSAPVPADTTLAPTPDAASFQTFAWNVDSYGGYIAKDNTHVWFDSVLVPNADSATFAPLVLQSSLFDPKQNTTQVSYKTFYLKDALHVWYPSIYVGEDCAGPDCGQHGNEMTLLPSADPATFTLLNSELAKDKSALYEATNVVPSAGVDLASLAAVPGRREQSAESCFVKDSTHVYTSCNTPAALMVVPDADPATFTYIDYHFQKDVNHVYISHQDQNHIELDTQIFPDADPATFYVFETISENVFPEGYEVDKNHVFYWGTVIPNADPATFSMSNNWCDLSDSSQEHVGQDANHMYCGGKVIDSSTFVELSDSEDYSSGYKKNASEAYYKGTAIPGADATTFELVPEVSSTTTRKNGQPVTKNIPAEVNGNQVDAKDSSHYYWEGTLVQ